MTISRDRADPWPQGLVMGTGDWQDDGPVSVDCLRVTGLHVSGLIKVAKKYEFTVFKVDLHEPV